METTTKLYDEILKSSFTIPVKVVYWNGKEQNIGDGAPRAIIRFNTPLKWNKVVKDASLALAEAYMKKEIEIEGSVQEVMRSVFSSTTNFMNNKKYKLMNIVQNHDRKHSREDISHHYDIGNEFYKMWLDNSMTYSCAYFKNKEQNLENAQQEKIEHILKKLRLKEGETLLDIGCGWGNLIITASKEYKVKAVGCTLSKEQYQLVMKRIDEENLQDLVSVKIMDYRDMAKAGYKFNKIASVGMFEHVGRENIDTYIGCVEKMLKDKGLALIHGISGQRDINDKSKGTDSFLNKYIFPGGYIPSIAEIIIPANKRDLHLIDFESMRLHYQRTLEIWSKRFKENWKEIEKDKDETFMRMWDLYLQGCAAIFEAGALDVCQYLFEKGTDNTRPYRRDYMI